MNIRNKKILVLAAHPDDETLGCGGTIYKLSLQSNYIKLITFTDGEGARGPSKYNRNNILPMVSSMLGIMGWDSGHFPDNEMDQVSMLELSKFIEQKVNFIPDIIFTHHSDDLNVDHQRVYQATMTAFRPQNGHSQKILSYYVPSSTEYNPNNTFEGNNLYVTLNTVEVENKMNTLDHCYHEEMRKYPHVRSFRSIQNRMALWGNEVGVDYAEKFKVIREVI